MLHESFPFSKSKFNGPPGHLLVPWNEYIQVILTNKKKFFTEPLKDRELSQEDVEKIYENCVAWYKDRVFPRPQGNPQESITKTSCPPQTGRKEQDLNIPTDCAPTRINIPVQSIPDSLIDIPSISILFIFVNLTFLRLFN